VFTYTLLDYDPERDGDEEAWAADLAEQGWQMWEPGPGPWIKLEGRRLRRWSIRGETPNKG
jgi:hypothetical protein